MIAPNGQSFIIGNRRIAIDISADTYTPTSMSRMLASSLHIPLGSVVADIGCGVGELSIYAAMEGAAKVYAVDIMESACALARSNAARNRVSDRVSVHCGNLFDPLPSDVLFDVIIGDPSATADEVAGFAPWYPSQVPTGGYDGAENLIALINAAPSRLKKNGVLYLPITSLSNAPRILDAARSAFESNVRETRKVDYPFCSELSQNMGRMTAMKHEGIIDFENRGAQVFWSMRIYRAWM